MDDSALFSEIYPSLRRFAAAISTTSTDPDDLLQEAIVRTLRRGPISDLKDPVPYLRRAVLNLARNQSRDSLRQGNVLKRFRLDSVHLDDYPSSLQPKSERDWRLPLCKSNNR